MFGDETIPQVVYTWADVSVFLLSMFVSVLPALNVHYIPYVE